MNTISKKISLEQNVSIIEDKFRDFKVYLRSRLPKRFVRAIITNPYPQYSDEYKCVFIHIPKTAGISISRALFDANPSHCFADKYAIFDPEKFNTYFKFAFVRNPWDRFLSAYKFLQQGGICSYDKQLFDIYCSEFQNFNDFVMALENTKLANKIINLLHFKPQYEYICDNQSNIIIDYIGKFENINNDFNYIASRLKSNAELIKINQSKHKNYQDYYTEASRKIIFNLYEKDINLFGYKFED